MATYCTILAERRDKDAWVSVGTAEYSLPWGVMRPPEVLWLDGRDAMWTVLCGRVPGSVLAHPEGFEHSGLLSISAPRGLPDDLSAVVRGWASARDEADLLVEPSWLMIREILDFDWRSRKIHFRAYAMPDLAALFEAGAPFPRATWPEGTVRVSTRPPTADDEAGGRAGALVYTWRPEGAVEVRWAESHLGYLGERSDFFASLEKLGPPDETRLVFWRDQ